MVLVFALVSLLVLRLLSDWAPDTILGLGISGGKPAPLPEPAPKLQPVGGIQVAEPPPALPVLEPEWAEAAATVPEAKQGVELAA